MPKINLTRREFLKVSGASLFLAGIPIPGFTQDKPPGTISVIILEGGMDGLSAVPPIGDPNLSVMRKDLVPANFLKINSFFGYQAIHRIRIHQTLTLKKNYTSKTKINKFIRNLR